MSEGLVTMPVGRLGARLREERTRAGLSLRGAARELGVSPSFVSQIENGKSQPSVATLYSLARLLNVSIDELFAVESETPDPAATPVRSLGSTPKKRKAVGVVGKLPARSDISSPAEAFPQESSHSRVAVTRPGERSRLEMDTGVVWERLATNTGPDFDFMEIIYPAHSSSTSDGRMLQHAGFEFGYLVEGELEITAGFDVFTLRAGDSMSLDSSLPHLLTNRGDEPARGIWLVAHQH
ncbi:helix-turn-helix domain-containing protein [Phycicoccus sp. Root101]|uniref:helix-turn-helix domain-containing protein n=1 Tax=Phycicoccus sp. Root101 TaxID=1736421 RepID=UPI000A54FEBD|nr:XRE family transcriptional regulator [Phycicoccus sp. Root101]